MKKILYISGTRADYGLMKETMRQIRKNPRLTLEIAATGMHMMEEFGKTVKEIKREGFNVHEIPVVYRKDTGEAMARFVGELIQSLIEKVKKIKPNVILILGDRGEMLAGAIVGAYMNIPVAHIHGGDVSFTVDETVRHAITKLSHIHFAATEKSAERIKKMGEDPWRIFIVGAPGLDSVLHEKLLSRSEVAEKFSLDPSKPALLVIQHPVSFSSASPEKQLRETMEAVKELGYQTIVVYPNADAGGRKMIKVIKEYKKYAFIKTYKNIPHRDYLSLMNEVDVMVGNSSGGIIEAPSFHLPVVNIGERQRSRERALNVIDAKYDRKEIKKAVIKALFDKGFRGRVKKCGNPYGFGLAGEKIADILDKIKIDRSLIQKQITY